MKRYRPLTIAAALLLLLAAASAALFLLHDKPPARKALSRRYPGTLAFLGTELSSGPLSTEPEYDETTNQTSFRLALADGGYLLIDEDGALVGVENFGDHSAEGISGTLADLSAAVEQEFSLNGYVCEERELSAGQDLRMLIWEKQVGGYQNPYDSVRVVVDTGTTCILLLQRCRFIAEETTEPAITASEAWELAAPYIGNESGTEVRLGFVRPNLNAGKGGVPKLGTEVRLAYCYKNDPAGVAVDIDAVTGDLLRLDHH